VLQHARPVLLRAAPVPSLLPESTTTISSANATLARHAGNWAAAL
jgi:hypothetical protein